MTLRRVGDRRLSAEVWAVDRASPRARSFLAGDPSESWLGDGAKVNWCPSRVRRAAIDQRITATVSATSFGRGPTEKDCYLALSAAWRILCRCLLNPRKSTAKPANMVA